MNLTRSIIINKALADQFGWSSHEAFGERFTHVENDHYSSVIGIINDIQFSSLHETSRPSILDMANGDRTRCLKVMLLQFKLNSKDISEAIELVTTTWMKYTNDPLEYFYVEDKLDQMYENEGSLVRIA